MELIKETLSHYNNAWHSEPDIHIWHKGPLQKTSSDFRVLVYKPTSQRGMWTYATLGMATEKDDNKIELHLFSNKRDDSIIELLTTLAYYHQNTAKIKLNESVNFGRPWQDSSLANYGFISLPYLDGPDLEMLEIGKQMIKFYWLIPITEAEVQYKKTNGVDALEDAFDNPQFNYIDPNRKSVV